MSDTYSRQTQTASIIGIEAMRSKPLALKMMTQAYLEQFDPEKELPTPERVQDELLAILADEFMRHNKCVDPKMAFEVPDALHWTVVAEIIFTFYIKNKNNKTLNNTMIKKLCYSYNNALLACQVDEIIKRINDLVEMDNAENWMTEDDVRVNEFKQHILSTTRAGCLPTTLLGVMYQKWHRKNYPELKPYPRNLFLASLKRMINPEDGWYFTDTSKRPKKSYNLNAHDPLLEEFQCSKMLASLPTHIRGLFKIDGMP